MNKVFKFFIVIILLLSFSTYSQVEAFHNKGSVKIHSGAKIGFHTNLINNGKFDENQGFAGFYSDTKQLTVLGDNRAIFNNLEVGVLNDLYLKTSLGVRNDFTFLEGRVITPRKNPSISLDFINYNSYIGEDNAHYVDGYASVLKNNDFTFPIGHDDRLRPMILSNNDNDFRGAYFFETPENPTTFSRSFTLSEKEKSIGAVNPVEFWDLNGAKKTTITLTWDTFSNISFLANSIKSLIVVGWNKKKERWQNLGNTFVEGDLTTGKITSKEFIPDDFEILTIGANGTEETCNGNYLISPNGDSKNEYLQLFCLKNYPPNNVLSVYNRWGNLVYKMKNYTENWDGTSEGRVTFYRSKKLPVGTYYYVFTYGESLSKVKKGWVYINR